VYRNRQSQLHPRCHHAEDNRTGARPKQQRNASTPGKPQNINRLSKNTASNSPVHNQTEDGEWTDLLVPWRSNDDDLPQSQVLSQSVDSGTPYLIVGNGFVIGLELLKAHVLELIVGCMSNVWDRVHGVDVAAVICAIKVPFGLG